MNSEQLPNGISAIRSKHSVDETVSRLERLLESRGIKLFAKIDHSGEAEKAGLRMPNTKLLIFGSARAGTPLMIASPTIAIDLPLKLLISEDAGQNVWVTYNSSDFIRKRHGVPSGAEQVLAGVSAIAGEIAG